MTYNQYWGTRPVDAIYQLTRQCHRTLWERNITSLGVTTHVPMRVFGPVRWQHSCWSHWCCYWKVKAVQKSWSKKKMFESIFGLLFLLYWWFNSYFSTHRYSRNVSSEEERYKAEVSWSSSPHTKQRKNIDVRRCITSRAITKDEMWTMKLHVYMLHNGEWYLHTNSCLEHCTILLYQQRQRWNRPWMSPKTQMLVSTFCLYSVRTHLFLLLTIFMSLSCYSR